MALTPDEETTATKIAAHMIEIALVELIGATGGGIDDRPDPLPTDADLATARAAFDEAAALYAKRSAMLLSAEPEGAAFLYKLEKGIAEHLRAFAATQGGGHHMLAAAGNKLRPVLLAARGAPLPARQQ